MDRIAMALAGDQAAERRVGGIDVAIKVGDIALELGPFAGALRAGHCQVLASLRQWQVEKVAVL